MNISNEEISGEWGLCVLVEFGDKKILVDAGASDLFLKNMEKLGIDVDSIDFGILSYAHYDHAYGILKRELGDTVNQMKVGYQMEF